MRSICFAVAAGGIFLAAFLTPSGSAQQKGSAKQGASAAPSGDWPLYRRDYAGTGYSPLAEITTQNVASLVQVWTYRLQSDAPAAAATAKGKGKGGGGANSEATPIVVNGVMYLPAVGRVVALEPETGRELWAYEVTGAAPSRRGVAYWPGDGNNPPRIVFTAVLGLLIPPPENDHAARNGMVIVRDFVDVESSKVGGRAGFNEMVAYLKKHHAT